MKNPELMRSASHGSISQAGFTLIEVLAALIIVSLGMLGVIQAVNQTVNNTSYLRDKSIAHWVAMNQLTETRLSTTAPTTDTTNGTVDMAGQHWRWTMKVAETDLANMFSIEVNVRLADADEKSNLATVTGFYGTAVLPPGSARASWDINPRAANRGQTGAPSTTTPRTTTGGTSG